MLKKKFKFNFKKYDFIFDLALLLIIFISLYMGITYSTYHTDPWHWGVIVGGVIDYINGFSLFKDIHVLYGPGQIIFLKFINNFYSIDYFSIGVVTSIIYVSNLILIYFISKKISNKFTAFVIILIFFLLSNYAQTPWPDFYAGLCITFSILFLNLGRSSKKYLIFASLFLILSITFRTTYLYTIISGILTYLIFTKILKINLSNHIKYFFIYSFYFLVLYLLLIIINQNFELWIEQGILITSSLIEDKYLYNFDISYVYILIKFIYHFVFPSKLENFYFLLLFISSFGFLFFLLKKKSLNFKIIEQNNILFFFILALAGLIQSIYQNDVFRNLMSCVSIFIVFTYLINFLNKKEKTYVYLIIVLCLIPLIPKNFAESKVNIFPNIGYVDKNNSLIYDKNIFFNTNIKFFGKHKFNLETKTYYEEIESIICKYDTIANYSIDRTLGYICYNNLIPSPTISMNPIYLDINLEKKFKYENIKKNEILIADSKFKNKNLTLYKEIILPKYTRFTKSDLFRQTFDNKIYIYIGSE